MEISGYRDLEEIGRGGYAVVFRAHEDAFGRSVAIKLLLSPGLSDLDRTRFEREALAMGQLSWHPNIVVVHATGVTADGHPYLVEEFLENGSLGDRLRRDGALPVDEAVRHLIGLSAAAHTAHEAGLLHRDIKPDNALLDAFGRVKLADFGIAAVTGSTLTGTGMVTATIAHAAPEVLNGARATPAADVYSLGSTLYELLTGAAAFVRDTDDSIVPLVLRVTGDSVPDLRARGVPESVARIVEWTMAKEPGARPASALDLGRLLQGVQAELGSPVTEMAVRGGAPPPSEPTLVGQVPTPAPVTPSAALTTSPDGPASGATTNLPHDVVHRTPPPGPALPPTGPPPTAPAPARRSRLPLVIGALVLIAGAVVAGLVVTGGDDGGTEGTDGVADATAPPSDDPEASTQTIAVPGRPFRLTAGDDAVWVTQTDGQSVARIDPATNEAGEGIALGGEPAGVATTDGAVWVAVYDTDELVRIDPSTNAIVSRFRIGDGPRNVAAGPSGVWVPNLNEDTVTQVNPADGTIVRQVAVGAGPRGLTVLPEAVWVTNYEAGTITQIDPSSGAVVGADIEVGGHPIGVVSAGGFLWVSEPETDVLVQIDPDSRSVTNRIPVGGDPGGLDASEDAVWVTSSATDQLTRVDPSTGEIVSRVPVGAGPGGVSVHGDDVWVADTEGDTVTRLTSG